MKKLLLTMILLLSTIQADENPLAFKLPYGLEFGKKIPQKVLNRANCSDSRCKFQDKFHLAFDDAKKLTYIVFYNQYYSKIENGHKLPSKWKKLNLTLCELGVAGTTLEELKQKMSKYKNAKYYKHTFTDKKWWENLVFEVDGKYLYNFQFVRDTNKYKENYFCDKLGLWEIIITGDVLDEDY